METRKCLTSAAFTTRHYGKEYLTPTNNVGNWTILRLEKSRFSFFFLAEVSGPLKLARVPLQKDGTLPALARTEPQYRSVILDEHHASARWKFAATK